MTVENQNGPASKRATHEIEHDRMLVRLDTETVWGWGTPAGRLRAARRAELIVAGANLRPGMTVLEIGCGTGMFTEMFTGSGARIVAVDISPDLIEKAKARNLPADQVQFMVKRFEECDLDGPFDAVIGSSVLHHLDLLPALIKIHALLKPGGRISFAEPNMFNPQVYLERKLRFIRPLFWYISPDETAFVRHSLRQQLLKTGFGKIVIRPFDWLHPSTPPRLIPFVRAVERRVEKTPLICEFSGSLNIIACR